jgi:type IX secretion system substrate protein
MYKTIYIIIILLTFSFEALSQYIYQVDTIDENRTKSIRLKIPTGVNEVEGILMMGNPWQGSTLNFVDDTIANAFAKSINFAIMGTSLWGRFKNYDEFEIFEYCIDSLAKMSGHSELSDAPFMVFGCSNGGQMAHSYNSLRPEKCIAFLVDKGGYYINPIPDTLALKTPGILVAGELDLQYRIDAINDLFYNNRPRGALWSHILSQKIGHVVVTETHNLFLILAQEAYKFRYPFDQKPVNGEVELRDLEISDGWLSDSTTWESGIIEVEEYDKYTKSLDSASWHMNKDLAFLFAAHSSYNRVTRFATISQKVADSGDKVVYHFEIDDPWDSIIMFNRSQRAGAFYESTDTIFDFEYELTKTGFSALFSKVYLSSGDSSVTNLGVVFVNGKLEPVLDVPESQVKEKIKSYTLFPNPSSGIINLRFTNNDIRSVKVLNMDGNIIFNDFYSDLEFQVLIKEKGLFLVEIEQQGSVFVEKVIVR